MTHLSSTPSILSDEVESIYAINIPLIPRPISLYVPMDSLTGSRRMDQTRRLERVASYLLWNAMLIMRSQ